MPDASTIERIEVLCGPAAMLYGRSDPGGTFNIVSKQPRAQRRIVLSSQISTRGLRRGALDEQAATASAITSLASATTSRRC